MQFADQTAESHIDVPCGSPQIALFVNADDGAIRGIARLDIYHSFEFH
jgi:hypothetical protein